MTGSDHKQEIATQETALNALLDAERMAAERLSRAQSEADALIKAAMNDAVAMRAKADDALALELAELDRMQARELQVIEQEVSQAATEIVERYRNLSDDAVVRMAAELFRGLWWTAARPEQP